MSSVSVIVLQYTQDLVHLYNTQGGLFSDND